MKKILRFLYKPYQWFIFMPFLGITTLFFGTLAVLLSFVIPAKIASFLSGVPWARLNSYLTPMLVKVRGRNNINKNQSYVIVANHQSNFDIFVLYGWLGVDFKWVMKQELRKVPALGIACEKLGHIYIDRSNTEKAVASINAAKEKIVNGTSVIFFAEGTRQEGEILGKFKKGAFKMALDLKLPVLPITIRGTRNILPARSLDLFPGKVEMIIHESVSTEEYSIKEIQALIDKTKEIISSGL